jgi:hypothetical protein
MPTSIDSPNSDQPDPSARRSNPLQAALHGETANPFLDMGEREFAMWMHNPITAAFFRYLDDQVAVLRDRAADLVEGGVFMGADKRYEDASIEVVRGKLRALRGLQGIALGDIQGFYGKAVPDSQDA